MITLSIRSDERQNNDALMDLITEYQYVKLETKKECLIGRIDKLLFRDKKYYVLDKSQQKVFIFDINGKFISKIYSHGKNYDEYAYISDFDVNSKGNVAVLDGIKKTIFHFDNRGRYLDGLKMNFFSLSLAEIDSTTFLTYTPFFFDENQPVGRLLVLRNNQTIKTYFAFDQESKKRQKLDVLKPFYLSRNNTGFLFSTDLSDTIYHISTDGLNVDAKFKIDFGKRSLSSKLRKSTDYFFKNPTLISEGWHIDNLYETSTHFTCSFNMEGRTWVLFFDKRNNDFVFSSCASCDSPKPEVLSDMVVLGTFEDHFITQVSARFLLANQEYLKKHPDKPNNFTKENLDLIEEYKENDNPILVLFKL